MSRDNQSGPGRPPPLPLLRAFSHLHVGLYRLTRLLGDPSCLVTMTGAKSGARRTVPLMHIPHGDAVILVASQGGAPRHPAWYYNLVAHPDIEIEMSGRRRELRARLVAGEERAELWPVCVKRWAGYEGYSKRTTREIPVFLCEPR